MDLQRLKERYPILVSYMENQHYSWQYIKHVKNEARWILRESENYGWKTYDDVYQTCVKSIVTNTLYFINENDKGH